MLSTHPNDTIGMAVSQDMEHAGYNSQCATSSALQGPWLVQSEYGWQFDKTLLLKCSGK